MKLKRSTIIAALVITVIFSAVRVEAACAPASITPFTASFLALAQDPIGGSPTTCCQWHQVCNLTADAIFNSCMAMSDFSETRCKRERALAFIDCMNRSVGVCQPGCTDPRTGIRLPCNPGEEPCTWGGIN